MKSKLFFSLFGFVIICLISCKSNKPSTSHNSRNSLAWAGVYTGILPCGDCEGIHTMIKLNRDLTFVSETKYAGKSNEIIKSNGSFSWDKSGNKISLKNIATNSVVIYSVGEKKLIQMDLKGNPIIGPAANNFILNKQTSPVVEKYWKLIEINGNSISLPGNSKREPHLILKAMENRIIGNAGCNSFFGSYEISGDSRITFSKIGATKMACESMDIENQFFKTLEMADNFTINTDTLSLNKAKMAPLARFVAVEMK